MALQQNVYNHLDNRNSATCWGYNDQLRIDVLEKHKNEIWEERERSYTAELGKSREEAKRLWKREKDKSQRNVSSPMPCTHPLAKRCFNDYCRREVSWEWGDSKNWCCGDRCVEMLAGPYASHRMKMNCIRMELKRYWAGLEAELDGLNNFETTFDSDYSPITFDSPTSVLDTIEHDGMFDLEDIMPLDSNSVDLYCYESLSTELK
jgi:hypothetical protein